MKVDRCVDVPGVPGVPGLLAAVFSSLLRPDFDSIPCRLLELLLSEVLVALLSAGGRPSRAESAIDVASSPEALLFPFLLAFASGCMLSSFKVWIGMSATPIIICVAVPIIATAAPEMGSVGPSSIAYSRARYLWSLDIAHGNCFDAYSLSSEKLISPSWASTVAVWALSLVWVLFTLQTAGRLGVTAHRNSS